MQNNKIDNINAKYKAQQTKQIVQEITENVIDFETGEIKKVKKKLVSKVPVEPNYIKIYLQDIMYFMDMPSSASGILLAIAKRMGYENKVTLVKPIKEDIAKETGLGLGAVNNAITNFRKKGILVSAGRSVYIINPHLIGKGAWTDIYSLRLKVEYHPDGTRTIEAERENVAEEE